MYHQMMCLFLFVYRPKLQCFNSHTRTYERTHARKLHTSEREREGAHQMPSVKVEVKERIFSPNEIFTSCLKLSELTYLYLRIVYFVQKKTPLYLLGHGLSCVQDYTICSFYVSFIYIKIDR